MGSNDENNPSEELQQTTSTTTGRKSKKNRDIKNEKNKRKQKQQPALKSSIKNVSKSKKEKKQQGDREYNEGGNNSSRGLARGRALSFNLSFMNKNNKGGGSKSSSKKNKKTALAESLDVEDVKEDPVLALFKARTTQRVRFSLEGMGGCVGNNSNDDSNNGGEQQQQHSQTKKHSYDKVAYSNIDDTSTNDGVSEGIGSAANGNNNANGSIKSFMKRALFSNSSTGRTTKTSNSSKDKDDVVDDFEAVVAKEIQTAKESGDPEMVWESSAQTAAAASIIAGAEASVSSVVAEEVVCTKTTTTTTKGPAGSSSSTHGDGEGPAGETSTLTVSTFTEDEETRAQVTKLLNKGTRAQYVHFRYEYAVKCCVRALELLKKARYPDDHPTVVKTLQSLNNAHHSLSSYQNSANIVKMGIRYEDSGELVRALKMYTIAYRIRRDNLSVNHPSLAVLLNMLGSIQVKRDELEEAMEIYELSLKDDPVMNDGEDSAEGLPSSTTGDEPRQSSSSPHANMLARSVAYREMGTIYERWGEVEEALKMYHQSLDCVAEYKGISMTAEASSFPNTTYAPTALPNIENLQQHNQNHAPSTNKYPVQSSSSTPVTEEDILLDLESVHLSRSFAKHTAVVKANNNEAYDGDGESGGMELFIGSRSSNATAGGGGPSSPSKKNGKSKKSSAAASNTASHTVIVTSSCYDAFFPPSLDDCNTDNINKGDGNEKPNNNNGKLSFTSSQKKNRGKKEPDEPQNNKNSKPDYADVDIALTLHQIGQLHRAEGEYNMALAAYTVALRGMKHALGSNHPNVAAILGNIGNLQKEMGDMTAAFETYQQVLAIESFRLGLSHPDVAITLHNIATIDAARGNYDHALRLYAQVTDLQAKLFGDDHLSLSVTAACMGDVYERIGNIGKAIEWFEEAVRIKTAVLGRHSLEVARILHKLGKLSVLNDDYHIADSYLSRTVLIYRLNKLPDDDDWLIDANRDVADIDAMIAMGPQLTGNIFEC